MEQVRITVALRNASVNDCTDVQLIGIPCVVGMWYLIPETKGRSAAELDELFERGIKFHHFHRAETATQLALKAQDMAAAERERRPSAVESSLQVPLA